MSSKHPAEYFIYFLRADLFFLQLHVVCWKYMKTKHIQEADRVAEENSFISSLV